MQPNNTKCGVGIAYSAHIGGIRMLDGGVTDSMEASSLGTNPQHVHIFSASWGPDDGGYTVEGPAYLARRAMEEGVVEGRGGKGSIYVWASGNGGIDDDDCNTDGYANSIYTLVVSSTTEHQTRPFYSEHCAASLATTFSSGGRNEKKVLSIDLHDGCMEDFTGTSASAPIAAGICALALEANGNLTWRDLQYLVVVTSKRHQLVGDWLTNGAGYEVSHWFGFGLMDAGAMVEKARTWETLPPQYTCTKFADTGNHLFSMFTRRPTQFTSIINIEGCKDPAAGEYIHHLEHIQLTISAYARRRGNVVIKLTSPSGTESTLLSKRREDRSRRGFSRWTLMSVHFWGENPAGNWTLQIGDGTNNNLIVKYARLTLRGTSTLPASLLQQSQSIPDEEFGEEEDDQEEVVFEPEVQDPDSDGERPQSPEAMADGRQRQRRAAAGWDTYSSSSWDSSWWWSSSDYFPFDQCHEECLYGCEGAGADECYKCAHYKDRDSMECVKTCPIGQFSPPELHVRCGKCSRHCEKCSGPKPSDCLTCPNGKYLSDQNTCVNSCGSGYYADEFFKLCRQCAPLCTSCAGNENTCTHCIAGAVLRGSQCITRCMDSEYLDETQCRPCHASCFACSGPSERQCTACYDDYVHKDMTCVRPNLCGEGFYITNSYDASLRQCLRCHSTCKTCQGPSFTQCLSCRQSTFLAGGACLQTCENGKFLDELGGCKECSEGCIVCSDENTCIQCEARRVLWQDGSDKVVCKEGCPDGQYSREGQCFPCHSSCETCNGGGIMDCTSCTQTVGAPKYLLEGACVSYCPYGYFSYERDHTCEQCDDSCKRCSGFLSTDCLECAAGLRYQEDTGRCIEDTNECTVPACDLCAPGNAEICLTCQEASYLESGSCLASCPDGKLPNPRQRVCELCHPSCKTCEGESDECTSCDQEYYLDQFDSMCVTECPDDTYISPNDNRCLGCDDKCWTCAGPGPNACTSCYEITEFLSGTECIQHCPDGQYGDEYTGTCRSCHPSCHTCGGPGDHECYGCQANFKLTEGFCRSACTGKSYTDSSGSCVPCHDSCQTCTGPTETHCLSCNYYNFLDDQHQCVVDCPVKYYPDYESNVCRPCHDSCATCLDSGPEDCIECSSSTYMLLRNGQLCVDMCPEGFYESDELQFKDCRQCSIECRDCHGTYLNCISCHDGTYLYQERCFSTCPSGYEEDPATNHCIQRDRLCPLFCQECDDWGDCTTCEDNYVEYFGECVWQESMACETNQYIAAFSMDGTADCQSCHESCATCLGPNADDCVSCHSGYHFKGSQCVQLCGDGMYSQNNKCYDCHPTCDTCDGGSALDCKSCHEGMRLDGGVHGMCNSGCPDGTYAIYGSEDLGEVTACQSCHHRDTCTACFGPEKADCLTCHLGFFRLEDGSCALKCPINTYEYIQEDASDGNECRNCHVSCESCIGPSAAECTSCPDEMVHLNGQCLWDCDEGYYSDDQKVCQRCDETCQTCTGPLSTNCMSCKVGKVVQEHVCVSSCQAGFFTVLSPTPTCMPCDPSCESCSDFGPFDCTSCYPNHELQDGVCYNRCGSGKYYDSKSKQCGMCSTDCLECYGPDRDQCIFCKGELRLEKLDKNHTQCIPCCSNAEPDVECCELCEPNSYKCTRPNVRQSQPGGVVKVEHIGVIVFAVIVVVILFFIVFGLLQARSNGRMCWRHRYANVPAYSFNTKDNKYVTLGKPNDDYYEEDIYGEVSDDEEDDMLEEPDTFQTMGTPYKGQADHSLDKNGVIDHL